MADGDTVGVARKTYARRLAIVEPVFANLRHNKGLNRFTYRGLGKVSVQWRLYCLVHNLEKIAHYSRKYGPKRLKTASRRLLSLLLAALALFWEPFRRLGSYPRLFSALPPPFSLARQT